MRRGLALALNPKEENLQMPPKKRRKPTGPDVDQDIYGARDRLGTISIRSGIVRARTSDGKKLGAFASSNAAMAAIIDASGAKTDAGAA